MQRDVQRLLRRIAILALLVTCTVLVTAERNSNTVFAANFCSYCSPFHSQCYSGCQATYNNCIQHYPASQCQDALYSCALNCDANQTFCQANCNSGGGGSGGPWPKGSCGADCYDQRADCLLADPAPEWIEDCLNEGGSRHTCCSTVFYDCMGGC